MHKTDFNNCGALAPQAHDVIFDDGEKQNVGVCKACLAAPADLAAARAEIERLQAEVVSNAGAFGKLHNIIGELEGEIEKLKTGATLSELCDLLRRVLACEIYSNNADWPPGPRFYGDERDNGGACE